MEQVATGHDFSIMALVMQADPVVKGVMLMLALASVVCWGLIIEKTIRLLKLSGEMKKLEAAAVDPASIGVPEGLLANLLAAAESEAENGERNEPRGELRARMERGMRSALKTKLQNIEAGLPFLATIGSAGPFIGLFGTVWGIMNSFTSIAQRSDTSLAVVAPGIAEALFATAIGLAAAIPAVMAYNAISVSLGRSAARATTAIAELAKRLSRREPEATAKVEPLRAGKLF